MDLPKQFQMLAIALGLGLLVGLQRERSGHRLGGLRTFPLVTLFGALVALLGQTFGGWVVAAGFVALTGVMVVRGIGTRGEEVGGSGATTEVAMLTMFAVGAYLPAGSREIGIAVGASVAVLLQFKEKLHGLASRFADDDLRAIMQFALFALVILPALPHRAYGPYGVLNPHRIWLMVVLIVGINLGGYIAHKLLGAQAGTALCGILGGLVSSTATTVGYARRAATAPDSSPRAAVVIVVASTIVFGRLMVELAVAAPTHVAVLVPPIAVVCGAFALVALVVWSRARAQSGAPIPSENPAELSSAFLFGALYAGVLVAVAAMKDHFGDVGLYVVAILSGLTDVDAITLSTGQLVTAGALEARDGWRVVLVAAMANVAFKTAAVGVLGPRQLFKTVATLFSLGISVGALLLAFWPG